MRFEETLDIAAARQIECSPALSQQFGEYLDACVEAQRFSGAVLVTLEGKVLLNTARGLADLEKKRPVTPSTIFCLASLTKQFTAMAVLTLQEAGKLNVHDPVYKHLSCAPARWQEITIHHLLSHTSGIPDFTTCPEFEQVEAVPRLSILDTIAPFDDKLLLFKPGEKFDYSNSNYNLLGAIIESVSGMSYESFLAKEIFAPLGMNDSSLGCSASKNERLACGYMRREDSLELVFDGEMSPWPYASGGLCSTVEDLYLWDQALSRCKLVSKSTQKAMFTPGKGGYGYGWFVDKAYGQKLVSHAGGIDGFTAIIERLPAKKLSAVVLSNIEMFSVDVITNDLFAMVLKEPYKLPQVQVQTQVDSGLFSSYTGNYQLKPDFAIAITEEDGCLFAQATGQSKFKLFSQSPTDFFMMELDAQIEFCSNDMNEVTHLVLHQHKKDWRARKIKSGNS
jgi:CubicO group peptidase (beta-lactamase class C family)